MRKPTKWVYIFGFMPGMGQMMLGLLNRGLQFMLLFWGGIAFSAFARMEELLFFIPLLIAYAYFDGLQYYREILETGSAQDRQLFDLNFNFIKVNKKWIGWGLVGFGVFSLLNLIVDHLPWSISKYIPYDIVQQIIVIALFIGFGFKLLMGENVQAKVISPVITHQDNESGDI